MVHPAKRFKLSFLLVESEFCSDYFLNVVGQAFFSLALRAPFACSPVGRLAVSQKKRPCVNQLALLQHSAETPMSRGRGSNAADKNRDVSTS